MTEAQAALLFANPRMRRKFLSNLKSDMSPKMKPRISKKLKKQFKALGKSGVNKATRLLETFPRPKNTVYVSMTSDEVTALCPVTGQPDQYTVTISYKPDKVCIESKSLKLKLQSYRQKGLFCEAFADEILEHVVESIKPRSAYVSVIQKPRGGVSITASSSFNHDQVEDQAITSIIRSGVWEP